MFNIYILKGINQMWIGMAIPWRTLSQPLNQHRPPNPNKL